MVVFGVGGTADGISVSEFVRYQLKVPPPEDVAVNGAALLFWAR